MELGVQTGAADRATLVLVFCNELVQLEQKGDWVLIRRHAVGVAHRRVECGLRVLERMGAFNFGGLIERAEGPSVLLHQFGACAAQLASSGSDRGDLVIGW